jgi:tetratricopeptide (TPR) repeat protein
MVGWLWFLGTLVPVIGIVQVGGQAMADRYTYFPHIGLFIAVVLGVSAMVTGSRSVQKVAVALVVLALLACLAVTTRQLRYWRDSERLFTRTIAVTGPNPVARINLGVALEQQGRFADARQQYEAALAIDARRVQAHNNLANLLASEGEPQRALTHHRQALELNPNAALAHLNLGTTLVQLGRLDEALAQYETAQRLSPGDPRPCYLTGNAVLQAGLGHEAVQSFDAALRNNHQHLQSLVWLARTFAAHTNAEIRNGQRALQLAAQANTLTRNSDPFMLDTLAMAYAEVGRFADAQQAVRQAIQLLADAGDSGVAQLEARLKLYQASQPYRETFTSTVGEKPATR